MNTLAIITARGGSKRIPRKNIKPFLGKPIIAYSIESAINSGLFDEVMVSTDDDEIAETAQRFGASIPFIRSAKNANDFATTSDVIVEVLGQYKQIEKTFDYAICIYPTAAFVSSDLLIKGFELLINGNYDTVFPAMKFGFPIQRAIKLNKANRIEMLQPEHLRTRSQDLEQTYHDCGQFYWIDVEKFQQKQEIWTDNSGILILSEMEAHDIDNLEDWDIAEFKYQLIIKKTLC
jgi:N-acylneuraminate cytidylyltransferase